MYQNSDTIGKLVSNTLGQSNMIYDNPGIDSKSPRKHYPRIPISIAVPVLKPKALKAGESISSEYYPSIFTNYGF